MMPQNSIFQPPRPPTMPSTIMLVEDDDIVRAVTTEQLRSFGYRVVSASDGQEALENLAQVRPDLILSDVRMPRRNGFELLQNVRQDPDQEQTPFIIMTAKGEAADQRMGMSLGADDYIVKPFKSEDLRKSIEVRLKRAQDINDILKQQERFLMRILPHELRSPLTVIIGYADLMMHIGKSGEALGPADLIDYVGHIERSAARMLQLANDLALWSWLETQSKNLRMGLTTETASESLTAETLKRWCANVAGNYGRFLDCNIDAEETILTLPTLGLERVVYHLLDNALKFSLPSTAVDLTARRTTSHYEIVVTDSGRGMSEVELSQIGIMRQFGRDKFEQQGIGMGLVLVIQFARLAGGFFVLERNGTGAGMTARLSLPL
jgi:CheY-like chemotaxis protein